MRRVPLLPLLLVAVLGVYVHCETEEETENVVEKDTDIVRARVESCSG